MSVSLFVVEALLVLSLAVFLSFAIRKYLRHVKPNGQGRELDILTNRRLLLDNAETALTNSGGVLHPMAIAILFDGECEIFNWQNSEVAENGVDKWLRQRADETYCSIVVINDPARSRLVVGYSIIDSPDTEFSAVEYTKNSDQYELDKDNIIPVEKKRNYL